MRLQEHLNNKSQKEKYQTKEIIISRNKEDKKDFKKFLGGSLNLSEYPNLETLIIDGICLKSPLKNLDISNCRKLIYLDCSNNRLRSLNLTGNHQLEELNI